MKKGGARIILISIAAGVVLLAIFWLILEWEPGPPFSPPDQPREWARSEYEETFAPSASGPAPTLIESPAPKLKLTRKTGELAVRFPGYKSIKLRDHYEIFEPDSSGGISLPGGSRLRLEGIALVQNGDVEWSEKRSAQHPVEWLDPVSLKSLSSELTADWPPLYFRKSDPSSLLLWISSTGETPMHWFGARVYDDRTLAPAGRSSSFGAQGQDHIFVLNLLIWHQTPLRIAVDFAFGDPEFQDLELKPGAEVKFGDDAMIRVIDSTPNRNSSISWGDASARFSFRPSRAGGPDERSVIFHFWPPHNHRLIDFTVVAEDGDTRFRSATGDRALISINYGGKYMTAKTARVRRFPKLGRLVFELPLIPGLPEVANLFEAPIPRATFFSDNELRELIAASAGVNWNAWGNQTLRDSPFPMTLEDFSPADALKVFEEEIGKQLYFNSDVFSIENEAPEGRLAKLRKWWKRNKPRWLP